jgi:hypothetical protein
VGRAQEKALVWRTSAATTTPGSPTRGWCGRQRSSTISTSIAWTTISARSSSKFGTYFPYTAKLCINGNEWAKRQAAKAGIGFTALDNGFAAVEDVDRLQTICDGLGAEQIDALLRKWLAILPNPFTDDDEAAGYRYELSVLQAEFSLTKMLDRPVSGRIFFEQVLRDNLDIGRPDHIGLIFDRRIISKGPRKTPGRFRTRSSQRASPRACISTTRTPK